MATSSSSSKPLPTKKRKRASSTQNIQLDTLPLLLPKKSSENTVLVQLNDQALDLKGDAGTIGRLRVKNQRIELDLNGKKMHGQIYPSVTCMVVSIGKTDAKVTQIVDEICVVSSQEDMMKQMGGKVVGAENLFNDEDLDVQKKNHSSITKSSNKIKNLPSAKMKKVVAKPANSATITEGLIDLS
jgi:hypothetical protein